MCRVPHHITGPVQPPQLLPVPWAADQVTASSRASFSGLREEQREPAKDHAPSQQGCHGDNKRTTNLQSLRNRNLTCSARPHGQLTIPPYPALTVCHCLAPWALQPQDQLELL